MMKKGAWTEEEDTVLAEYVKRHGKGRWNMIERNTGLMRCGKSCRLRWYNHLRPNLKRGAFSPEEEKIVIELHAQIGNRWARIAMKLPGRSDNEIKNFWNTRAKRLERSGLPLYPKGVVPQYSPKRQRNQNHTTLSSSLNEIRLSNKNERSLPSLEPSYPNPLNLELKLSPQLSMGPFSFYRNRNPNPLLPNSYPRNINGSNSNLVSTSYFLPFSSTPSSSTLNYSNSQTLFSSVYAFQSQSGHFNLNPNPPLSMPKSYNPKYVFTNRERDHSSIESILRSLPSTCESSNGFYDPQFRCIARYANNGLMEYTFRAPKSSVANDILSRKGKEICVWDDEFGSSSPNTTTGIQFCDPIEKMLPSDDDLSALLESFRTEGPSTDWYQAFFGNSSNKK